MDKLFYTLHNILTSINLFMRTVIAIGVVTLILMLLGVGFIIVSQIASVEESPDQSVDNNASQVSSSAPERTTFLLDIETRSFRIGTSGYTPPNFPSPSVDDVENFWEQIDKSGEVHGVHVDWDDTGTLDVTLASTEKDLIVVIGFQDPDAWAHEAAVTELIEEYLRNNEQIKAVGIGNEINIVYEQYPEQFNTFLSAHERMYTTLKHEFPDRIFFTTFQYESTKGAGYLMGRGSLIGVDRFDIVEQMQDNLDAVGITLYPFFDYTEPEAIPSEYFSPLRDYTNLPIIVTETGWLSRSYTSGVLSHLSQPGYGGSEEEQVAYLKNLLDMIDEDGNVSYLEWAFINDFQPHNESELTALTLFQTIGLNQNNATPKAVWDYWSELATIPLSE